MDLSHHAIWLSPLISVCILGLQLLQAKIANSSARPDTTIIKKDVL